MKEQAEKEHVRSEEVEEETYRRLAETRRARPVAKRELTPRVKEQPPKSEVPPTKAYILLNIPIKNVKQLGFCNLSPHSSKLSLIPSLNPSPFLSRATSRTAPEASCLEGTVYQSNRRESRGNAEKLEA